MQAPELDLDPLDGMDFDEIEAQLYGHQRRQPEHNGALRCCCGNTNEGPAIKDVRTKCKKLAPLPALAQPPTSCPCGHTIYFKKSGVFSTKKCGRPHLDKPPPP